MNVKKKKYVQYREIFFYSIYKLIKNTTTDVCVCVATSNVYIKCVYEVCVFCVYEECVFCI